MNPKYRFSYSASADVMFTSRPEAELSFIPLCPTLTSFLLSYVSLSSGAKQNAGKPSVSRHDPADRAGR